VPWTARFGALVAIAVALGGCGSTIATMPLIGEPEKVPAAPAVRPDYPHVGESGSTRATRPLTPEERAKVEADLVAARNKAAQETREQINRAR
jgi:hypothetical protein